MANYYFVYDQYGNIVTALDSYPQLASGQQLLCVDDTAQNAKAAFNQRHAYMIQNSAIVPATTLTVTRTRATSGITEMWTLNITASDNAAHTVTLNIASLGYTETLYVPAVGMNYVVALRKSISNMQFMCEMSGNGIATLDVPVGGTNPISARVRAIKQQDGSILIKNISKSSIKSYGHTISVPASDILTDLMNMNDLFASGLIKLLQWAQKPTYEPLQLTSDESNAVNNFADNYLPLARLKLADVLPVTGITTSQNTQYIEILANKKMVNNVADEVLQEMDDFDVTLP